MANNLIKIECKAAGEPIVIDSDEANISVIFKNDTIEENVADRSKNVVNKVVVRGTVTLDTAMATKHFVEWSMDKSAEKVYRKVEMELYNNDVLVRKFTMDKAFCVDYTEYYNTDSQGEYSDEGHAYFELVIAQRKSNLEGITIVAGEK